MKLMPKGVLYSFVFLIPHSLTYWSALPSVSSVRNCAVRLLMLLKHVGDMGERNDSVRHPLTPS